MGNLCSVAKAFQAVGACVEITCAPQKIKQAKAIVLPGVGAFSAGMHNLRESGVIGEIISAVENGKPFLGICLGMQILFTRSFEHGEYLGLNFIKGDVVKFSHNLKIPHMGWNTIKRVKNLNSSNELNILSGIAKNSYFYFVHSYYVKPKDQSVEVASTEYSIPFTAIAAKDNIYGIQFHPEKSSDSGLQILKNFSKIAKEID